jgi:hypothetical protein
VAAVLIEISSILDRNVVLMISRLGWKMGYLGSKTRSQGLKIEKAC